MALTKKDLDLKTVKEISFLHQNVINKFNNRLHEKSEYDKSCEEFFKWFEYKKEHLQECAAYLNRNCCCVIYSNDEFPKLFFYNNEFLSRIQKEYFSDELRFLYNKSYREEFGDSVLFIQFNW